MRRLIFYILAAVTAILAAATLWVTLGHAASVNVFIKPSAGTPGAECDSYLICQNFEGAGYDNGEIWTSGGVTVNPDEATTVLRGSQSLSISDTGANPWVYSPLFTAQAHVYGHFMFRTTDVTQAAAGQYIFELWNGEEASLGAIYLAYNGVLRGYHGTATANGSTLVNDTTYHIWWEYIAGSGSDGVLNIWLSTSTTKPGSPDVSINTGTSTLAVDNVGMSSSRTGPVNYYDQVYVDDAPIGNVD